MVLPTQVSNEWDSLSKDPEKASCEYSPYSYRKKNKEFFIRWNSLKTSCLGDLLSVNVANRWWTSSKRETFLIILPLEYHQSDVFSARLVL